MDKKFKINIVLHCPEIPGNAGSIGRTCLALDANFILIKPYGFSIDEKSVRRAGLDYWKHIKLMEYDSWEDFLDFHKPTTQELFFIETKAPRNIYQATFTQQCYLIFGSETKGLPDKIIQKYSEQTYELPMFSKYVRSLNLSNAATAAAYLAHRELFFN
jgi:tRNA (cytidine/uridine-2'-O-)-methyltransferase